MDSWLKAMRLYAGWSVRDMESATGINRGRLSILERGVDPTAEERRTIIGALAKRLIENGITA